MRHSNFFQRCAAHCQVLCLVLSLALSLNALAQPASHSGQRLALVIGNDDYQKVSKLHKAGGDASAMARELKSAGFEVSLHLDLNYQDLVKAVEVFSNRINGGDQVVVFFAGHGVQIKTGSYLLPVDIEPSSESRVEKTAYGLADLTDKLSEAKASFALVIVDACRDNPLKKNGRSIGGSRGLSAIEPPKGQMVIYSASKGQQALDSLGDSDRNLNGVFTREFIKSMQRPGVRIEDLVREVQNSVETLALTVEHEQRPAIYNEARGNFYFYAQNTEQIQSATVADPESETWIAAQRANSAAAYQAYLDAYSSGRYVVAAKIAMGEHVKAQIKTQAGQQAALEQERQATGQLAQNASAQREAGRVAQIAANPESRFVVSKVGTIRDLQTGIEWSQSDNGAEIKVGDAINYCRSKGSDWRLPSVAELMEIYVPTLKTSCGRSFVLSITCKVSAQFRLSGHTFWSNDSEKASARPLSVLLENGQPMRGRADRAEDQRALCVRGP
jgi:hypothetical protein